MTYKDDFLAKCIVLDTETTGTDYKTAEIIESGFVIREADNWCIFQELHKPVRGIIPPKVESICYITNKMVEDLPSFLDSKEVFQAVLDGFDTGYAVGHNYFYDMRVLENHGVVMPKNSICTWRLSKKLFNGIAEIEETNLPYLRFALDLDIPIEMHCHRAGNDSYMTGKLLEALIDLMEANGTIDVNQPYGPQIAKWAAEPIIYERFPFGKHKGELLKDIPHSYWVWAIEKTDWFNEDADNYDPDLAASINAVLEG